MKSYLNYFFVFSLFVIVGLTSCSDDNKKEGDLQVNFKLQYEGQPLEMFKNYNYPITNEKLYFSRISFFLSNLVAKSGQGDVTLNEIDYLNLTAAHENTEKAKLGYSYIIKDLPSRSYTSLDFDIGVPASDNGKEPKDFPSTSTLSSNAEYWTAWKSYIFFRPEGQVAEDDKTEPTLPFALHLGSDEMLLSLDLKKAFTIVGGKTTEVDVIIDMAKFFNGTQKYNMNDGRQLHSLTHKPLMHILKDNLATAIK